MKLLYNEKEFLCTKTELISFKISLPLAKLEMVSSRLLLNGLILLAGISFNMQLIAFLVLSNVNELSTDLKTKK